MHYNALAAKGIIRSPIMSRSTRNHSVAAEFAENGSGREGGDGSAQRGRSVIYDRLVLTAPFSRWAWVSWFPSVFFYHRFWKRTQGDEWPRGMSDPGRWVTPGDEWQGFDRPDALFCHRTKPTVSRHWRKDRAVNPTTDSALSFLHPAQGSSRKGWNSLIS